MRAKEFLSEAKLQRSDFYKPERIQNFINKMLAPASNPSPFKLVGGGEVILKNDPALISALQKVMPKVEKHTAGKLVPIPNVLYDIEGNPVKLSQLEKTIEFGSSEKEQFPIKPSHLPNLSGTGPSTKVDLADPAVLKDILETATFPASDLGNRIITDPVLNKQAGKLGKVIIDLAKQIQANQIPVLPEGLTNPEINAIRDYAGEYLGVMQLINGTANFDNVKPFLTHLGTANLAGLKLYFPKASGTPLADSLGASDGGIAAVQSPTGTVMKISSKGNKIGAPPSLDNLDPQVVKGRKYATAVVKFIETARKYKADQQPFRLLNYLFSIAPGSVDARIAKVLPFSDEEITNILNSDSLTPLPQKVIYLNRLAGRIKGSRFGKCHYVINKEVIRSVNTEGALPNLKKAVLEILGSNFVQLYTAVNNKQLVTTVLWPNKVDGDVYLYSKAYAGDPGKSKLSFYVSN